MPFCSPSHSPKHLPLANTKNATLSSYILLNQQAQVGVNSGKDCAAKLSTTLRFSSLACIFLCKRGADSNLLWHSKVQLEKNRTEMQSEFWSWHTLVETATLKPLTRAVSPRPTSKSLQIPQDNGQDSADDTKMKLWGTMASKQLLMLFQIPTKNTPYEQRMKEKEEWRKTTTKEGAAWVGRQQPSPKKSKCLNQS